MSTPRFVDKVKAALLAREDLTTQTEINAGRGWRLAATVYYLKKKGWPIETQLDVKRIAHYRVPAGWSPETGRPNSTN